MRRLAAGLVLASLCVLVPRVGFPQWSSDPMLNTCVDDDAGDQVEPKVVATADGGCYVSWYDAPSGYDVRLQRLDPMGNELWPRNGITVGDTSVTWVTDYGLDVDAAGGALTAFRDEVGGESRIVAQAVDGSGNLLWGAGGIVLDATASGFVGAPEIVSTSDGNVVAAWIRDAVTVVTRLDPQGQRLWPSDLVLADAGGANLSLAHLRASDGGSAIVSLVRQQGFGTRHLLAQKLDTDGLPLWGAAPVSIFDSGSLQMGNFPDFISDGSGGAVFFWYQASANLQSYVQRLRSDGSEVFPHNGVVLSTNPAQQRVSPSAAYNPSTGDIFAFWVEEDLGQIQRGVYGQRVSATGARQWTDNGLEILRLGSQLPSEVRALPATDGAWVFFVQSLSVNEDHVRGARLRADGSFDCAGGLFDVATAASVKTDLRSAVTPAGMALLAFPDRRAGDNDIYAQNVNPDCTLGLAAGFLLYRGTVASLAPGWKATALPLDDSNDDPTGGYPRSVQLPGTDLDNLPAAVPLVLYRLLDAGGNPLGNVLRAARTATGVELSF